jgi:hypothetical protein
MSVNGTLVEDKMRRFKGEYAHYSFKKCPIYSTLTTAQVPNLRITVHPPTLSQCSGLVLWMVPHREKIRLSGQFLI